ncbi:MAG: HAD hydrolase-like protein [Candidatus Fermentibacter sp.]|nr:HAD hydrolase-like protein [Candidatus Fermentibacter sp.]
MEIRDGPEHGSPPSVRGYILATPVGGRTEDALKKLAVFDLDGTLHDSSAALTPALSMAMSEVGIDPPDGASIESLYGQPLDILMPTLVPDPALRPAFREALARIQKRTVLESGRVYPGVPGMLSTIRSMGWRTAVCSNAGRAYVVMVLEALGIAELLDQAEGLGDRDSKADTLGALIEAEAPCFTVMTGDRYLDFEAARANRIPSIGCTWGFGEASELLLADMVADSPDLVPGLLVDLMKRGLSLRSG